MSVSETHAGVKRAQRAGLVHVFDDQLQVSVRAYTTTITLAGQRQLL